MVNYNGLTGQFLKVTGLMVSLSVLVSLKLLKVMYTKAYGSKTKQLVFAYFDRLTAQRGRAAKEWRSGLMVATTSEASVMELNKVKAFISGQMGQDIKEIGWLMKCQEKVHLSGLMEETLRENLRAVLCTELVFTLGKMAVGTKVTTVLTKNMARELTLTLTEANIPENGLMAFNMASGVS